MTDMKELKDMETKIVYISEEYSLYYQGGSLAKQIVHHLLLKILNVDVTLLIMQKK